MEEPRPVKVDVSRDPGGYFSDRYSDLARKYPGERIVVHVPFEGDAGVCKLRPSSVTTVWPRGQVKNDELLLTMDYPCPPRLLLECPETRADDQPPELEPVLDERVFEHILGNSGTRSASCSTSYRITCGPPAASPRLYRRPSRNREARVQSRR